MRMGICLGFGFNQSNLMYERYVDLVKQSWYRDCYWIIEMNGRNGGSERGSAPPGFVPGSRGSSTCWLLTNQQLVEQTQKKLTANCCQLLMMAIVRPSSISLLLSKYLFFANLNWFGAVSIGPSVIQFPIQFSSVSSFEIESKFQNGSINHRTKAAGNLHHLFAQVLRKSTSLVRITQSADDELMNESNVNQTTMNWIYWRFNDFCFVLYVHFFLAVYNEKSLDRPPLHPRWTWRIFNWIIDHLVDDRSCWFRAVVWCVLLRRLCGF